MNLQSEWVVGFVDGEGCFHVAINKHHEMTSGFQVLPEFTVVRHKRDVKILHALKAFFKCGVVRKNHGERMSYRARNLEHLTTIILPFFEKHSLKTLKRVDFIKFRTVVLMMNQKKHLTLDGFEKIKSIKEQMNRSKLRYSPAFSETEEIN